jgi:hypothetical protein
MVQGLVDDASKSGSYFGPGSAQPTAAIATSSTPNVTVQLNFPSCNYKQFQIPIPAGTKLASYTEASMSVMAADGGEWDLFKVTPPGVTPLSSGVQCPATNNWAATVITYNNPGWTGSGSGPNRSYRGTGTLGGTGMIRPRDTQTPAGGTWDHAIALGYHLTSDGSVHPSFVAPATGGDGTCFNKSYPGVQCIPEGGRLQLDPSINCSAWASLQTMGEWARQECRTLQSYGAIIVDTGAGFVTDYYQQVAPYTYPWNWNNVNLPLDLLSHLRVIDWTKWTGAG